jgi:hypothetical protein
MAESPCSLIRNGGFEGSGKYRLRDGGWWTDEDRDGGALRIVADPQAPQGQFVLRLKGAGIRSPAFAAEPGSKLVVRCFARAKDEGGSLSMRLCRNAIRVSNVGELVLIGTCLS